jgi:hypothetical protein
MGLELTGQFKAKSFMVSVSNHVVQTIRDANISNADKIEKSRAPPSHGYTACMQ